MYRSEGDRQKERVQRKKNNISIKREFERVFSVKSCQPREMGLMRHRFNSTLQVTGLPDAIPLAPPLTSPNFKKKKQQPTTHTHKKQTQSPNRCRKQKLVKVKKTEEKAEETRRKWGVSKIKETGIG